MDFTISAMRFQKIIFSFAQQVAINSHVFWLTKIFTPVKREYEFYTKSRRDEYEVMMSSKVTYLYLY